MFDKKNHVGRPTNDEVRRRRIKKIAMYGIPAFFVVMLVVLISTGSLSNLMGNSVTQYYCENSDYKLEGTNCVKNLEMSPAVLGDVNFDGAVTDEDRVMLAQWLDEEQEENLTAIQFAAANIDDNDEINYQDLNIIKDYLNGAVGTYSIYYDKLGAEKVCPADYKMSGSKCVKKDVIPALLKKEDSADDQKYTITFNANGGKGEMKDLTAKINESVKLTKNSFTNGNKQFIGWEAYNKTRNQWFCYGDSKIRGDFQVKQNCDEAKNGKYIYNDEEELDSEIAKAGETIVLYAKWSDDDATKLPVIASFKPQDSSTSLAKDTKYQLNLVFDIKDTKNKYYYIWENYLDDQVKSKTACTEVKQGEHYGSFTIDGNRHVRVVVYSDSSCKTEINNIQSERYTCSNCGASPEETPAVETPVTVRLQTDFDGETANKNDVINVIPTFTVADQNQYYYIWRTYAYGRESYKSNCQEVVAGALPAKTLTMFAERQGGIQVYSDSSCSAKVGVEVRTKKIPCKGCSPVYATFDKHETTEYKKDIWVYNKLRISVDDTSKQYYYIWKTYYNGKLNYTSNCQKVYPDVVQNKGLHMVGTRYGEVIVYKDSSCKNQVDKVKTQTFTICSNCNTVDDEDLIEEIVPGSSSSGDDGASSSSGGDYYGGDEYIVDDGGDDGYVDEYPSYGNPSGGDTSGGDTSGGSKKTCTKWACPSGYYEFSGACRKETTKTSHANKICSKTTCPSGYNFEAGVCRKQVTKTVHEKKICAKATCPSGYNFEIGVCRKQVSKTSHANKVCATYKCPSEYSEWAGACRKEITKTANTTKECEKATCPSGYNFEVGVCRKQVTKTRHVDKVCTTYKCPSGYSEFSGACRKAVKKTRKANTVCKEYSCPSGYSSVGGNCRKGVTKYRTAGTICKSYKCPSGYSSWSGTCRKAVTKTGHANKVCASYGCPSGYSYTGGVCRKGNKATGKTCKSYKCPSGYSMKGGECLKTYTDYSYTSNKVCAQTGCQSGYSYSGGFCRQAYTDYDYKSKVCSNKGCPSGYKKSDGNCIQEYKDYDITSKKTCTAYKCPSGATQKAGECFENYKTYDITSKMTCQSYKCPSGYSKINGKCTQKTYDITSKKTCTSYKCPNGYTQKGGECFKEYKEYDITSKMTCQSYKCPSGYTLKAGECFKETKAYSITSNYVCKEYKCPSGYTSKAGECFKDIKVTDIKSKTCKSYN